MYAAQLPSIKNINWDKTCNILSNYHLSQVVLQNLNTYVDDEIEGEIERETLMPLFGELDNFPSENVKYTFDFIKMLTDGGTCYGMKRRWTNSTSTLEFLITRDNGFAIIFSNEITFVILMNSGSHPAVITSEFSFFNSDGSTYEDVTNFPLLTLSEVVSLLKEKMTEYLFEPQH